MLNARVRRLWNCSEERVSTTRWHTSARDTRRLQTNAMHKIVTPSMESQRATIRYTQRTRPWIERELLNGLLMWASCCRYRHIWSNHMFIVHGTATEAKQLACYTISVRWNCLIAPLEEQNVTMCSSPMCASIATVTKMAFLRHGEYVRHGE